MVAVLTFQILATRILHKPFLKYKLTSFFSFFHQITNVVMKREYIIEILHTER